MRLAVRFETIVFQNAREMSCDDKAPASYHCRYDFFGSALFGGIRSEPGPGIVDSLSTYTTFQKIYG
jgi:hypothetical protein